MRNAADCASLIVHLTDWGPPDDDGGSRMLTLDLRRRDAGGRLVLEQHPVLDCARGILQAFVRGAVGSGCEVRVDVARQVEEDGSWPRWATAVEQVPALFGAIASAGDGIHPVSIWLLPGGAEAEGLLDEFRAEPFDSDVYHSILERGVVRVSLEDTYCDVVFSEERGAAVLAWMRAATETAGESPVQWLTM